MKAPWKATIPMLILALIGIGYSLIGRNTPGLEAAGEQSPTPLAPFDQDILNNAAHLLQEGRDIFRFDPFGDEAFWGDQLQLHQAIATASPKTALALGLKVDVAALPSALLDQLQQGAVNLNVGAIVALAPNLKPVTDLLKIVIPSLKDDDVRTVLLSWGPGKFDVELF